MPNCPVCHGDGYDVCINGMRDWEYGAPGDFRFIKCRSCSIIRLDPFPSLQDLVVAYPAHYPAYLNDTRSKGYLYQLLTYLHFIFVKKLVKNLLPHGGAVLDVGAGNGDFLQKLKMMGAGRIVGIDFNKNACNIMLDKGIEVFNGIFLDFVENSDFDIISMNNYIEHVLDPVAEVQKAWLSLKPGGKFIGSLPNFNGLDRSIFGRYWGGNHAPRHTFQFTPVTLHALLKNNGFVDITIRQDVNPGHIAISVQNFLQKNVENLANNPRLKNGRAWYYNYLLLICFPINLLFILFSRSGVIGFSASRPL